MARILWVSLETPDRNGQGGQRRQYHQIRALLRRGHEITVLAPRSAQSDDSIGEIVPVRRPRPAIRGRFVRFFTRRIGRVIASPDWDAVVVSHHESWRLMPGRDALRAPVLLDVHNVMSSWHRTAGRIDDELAAIRQESAALAAATAVTTCSETERRRLVTIHPEAEGKSFVAPLGVDPDEWPEHEYHREAPVVAAFGSWSWHPNERGLEWFLAEVWPRVHAAVPDAVALIAGSGVRDASRWPEGARFVGRVADLAGFTAEATVVVVPVLEGVGASVKFAESLATGASVAATPDGANAFCDAPAMVSADARRWADWITERLQHRLDEPAPAPARAIALRELSWDAATAPIDAWLQRAALR